MTEQRFTIQPRVPTWSILFVVLALLCGGLYFATFQIEWVLAALLPAVLAVFTWRRGRASEVELRESSMEISNPPHSIHWHEIEAVQIGNLSYPVTGQIPNRPLLLLANGQWIMLAGNITPGLNQLYRSILNRLPVGGVRSIPRKLQDFLHEQLGIFGEERVWSFAGSRRRKFRSSRLALLGLSLMFIGVVWLVHQVQNHREATPLGITGGMLIFGGLITLLISLVVDTTTSARVIKKPEDCGIVISPKAFAMIQGPLAGTLRWDEIRGVNFGSGKPRAPAGVMVLQIEGALLTVFDIYDRPLAQIHELVMKYWDHEA